MLTLNSLDSKGYLSRTNFDINRTVKDTAATFEGTCSAKESLLICTFSDSIQMVYADLGKIQQVLYNLIDNAIKFSREDSVIYIQTSVRYEKVFVSVKDTGVGIPKNNIKRYGSVFIRAMYPVEKTRKEPDSAWPLSKKLYRPTVKILMWSVRKALERNLFSACRKRRRYRKTGRGAAAIWPCDITGKADYTEPL